MALFDLPADEANPDATVEELLFLLGVLIEAVDDGDGNQWDSGIKKNLKV